MERLEAAAELALELGHPLKDCLYLALAIEHDCDLVTCDRPFAMKARDLHPLVKLLSEFDISEGSSLTDR